MNQSKVRRLDNGQKRSRANAERIDTPGCLARGAPGQLFGTADSVEASLSDLQWVTLWAQIYGAEVDALFGTRRH